ncbi:hypothetical protein [Rhodococcus sp. B50]|uniref:hypothetical protein n=1 Tax=Rhodococcus sp. B50 TaxID=2682847 RepID=UPI001BD553A2|nr:hypothetical protein [Rhodococcus sp. B50]
MTAQRSAGMRMPAGATAGIQENQLTARERFMDQSKGYTARHHRTCFERFEADGPGSGNGWLSIAGEVRVHTDVGGFGEPVIVLNEMSINIADAPLVASAILSEYGRLIEEAGLEVAIRRG